MNNILKTDGYKFSMAQAGFPLRRETFYLSFRRGGWQYIPYDLAAEVRKILAFPLVEKDNDQRYLRRYDYDLSPTMIHAFAEHYHVDIRSAPPGTWVHEREPILTITGPSFLVSWLEPLMLRLFFPIQLATEIKKLGANINPAMLLATCEKQAEIMRSVITAVAEQGLEKTLLDMIKVDENGYRKAVTSQATKLLDILGDPNRIFEVGMRAATCESQHRIVLEALRELGIKGTSNVSLAREFDMKPVGTMGHEHVQRWGNDLAAYRAMRDLRVSPPSYLLDTTDTITSGIPAAIQSYEERPHDFSIRYDSGDKYGQYVYAHGEFERHNISPVHVLEDGLDDEMTGKFEELRTFTKLPPTHQLYGYGGFLVSKCWPNPLTRDRAAAVYKLTMTSGEGRMKWGNEAGLGKISVPGHPVAWRRLRGSGPLSIIGQLGENIPENYLNVTVHSDGHGNVIGRLNLCRVEDSLQQGSDVSYVLSPATQKLVDQLSSGR